MKPGPNSNDGFTVIELLVVIAILAVLAAMLLPALAEAKKLAQGAQCMNNCSQMTKAWTMYACDNKGSCVNNYGIEPTEYDIESGLYNTWCFDVMDWTTASENTNTALLSLGLLGQYMAGSVSFYKCPADQYLSAAQQQAQFQERVRSYSMNDFLGYFSDGPDDADGPPGTGIDSTYQGKNEFNNSWPQYLKLTDIPQPANVFVFLDEHPDSINDGYFDPGDQGSPGNPTSWSGSDLPASYHNGAAGFSFSDGHSEIHKWLNSATDVPVVPGGPFNEPGLGVPPNYVDRIWLCGHACIQN